MGSGYHHPCLHQPLPVFAWYPGTFLVTLQGSFSQETIVKRSHLVSASRSHIEGAARVQGKKLLQLFVDSEKERGSLSCHRPEENEQIYTWPQIQADNCCLHFFRLRTGSQFTGCILAYCHLPRTQEVHEIYGWAKSLLVQSILRVIHLPPHPKKQCFLWPSLWLEEWVSTASPSDTPMWQSFPR